MLILATDTATGFITVALCDEQGVLAETAVRAGRKHSERLLNTTDWLLRQGGVALADVDVLAVSIGPGSFTGLRVGVAAWKGLALAAHKPLVAVPTLDAMARLAPVCKGTLCVLLDAKMGEVFGAVYRFEQGRRQKQGHDRVCPVEDILADLRGPALFLGDGAQRYMERIRKTADQAVFAQDICSFPRASAVAVEAARLLEQGADTDPDNASPLYLRKSQAEENQLRDGR